MSNQNGVDILPAIDDIKALGDQGWNLSINTSTANGERFQLVGITARRDIPGGTIEIRLRSRPVRQNSKEDVVRLARDLRDLCSGLNVRRIE